MRLTNVSQSLVLPFRRAQAVAGAPGWWGPALTMLPGLACWLLFASAAMPHELPVLSRLTALLGTSATNVAVLIAWALAVVTSAGAGFFYGRRPQVWYVTVCIAFHLTGLIFSLLLAVGLLVLMVA